ncbi:unnamed protein product, partial [Ilex paraguariensis]
SVYREQNGAMMRSTIVSSILVDQIKDKPSIKPIEVVKDFKKYYGLDISYHNIWYEKKMVKNHSCTINVSALKIH